ncbi:hypothetical protein DFO55_10164 [Grimontella sp. AG753]|nr:hypothetical protein DFO55_10164 [Grimontella sp. AG753]
MFDNTPLEPEEIIDQCRALSYAVIEIDNPQAKELLSFVLWERLDFLYRTYHSEIHNQSDGIKSQICLTVDLTVIKPSVTKIK